MSTASGSRICPLHHTAADFKYLRQNVDEQPMRGKGSGNLFNWLLVVVVGISSAAAVATVLLNTSANRAISLEAERTLAIADMQAAIQNESDLAAQFVAHLPGMGSDHSHNDATDSIHSAEEEATDLADHPEVLTAAASFDTAARRLLTLASSPEQTAQVQTAVSAHDSFIESLRHLNDAVHDETDAMSIYHADTQVTYAHLTTNIQQLRGRATAGLNEAVKRSEWSHTLLTATLPIATVGAVIASIGLVRARRARLRVEVLEHVVSEKDRFIGTVSHELRTPMAAIIGFTELLSNDENNLTDAEKSEYLSLVLSQGNEVSAIVDDLLVAARAEIGDLTAVSVPINLAAQARQVVETLDFPSATPDVPDSTSHAIGDPGRVRQIIRNLLTNAIRHGGPAIRILIKDEDSTSTIEVRDNGHPIPPDDQSQMFEPYTRLKDAQPVTGSIGIGLSVSRQLARLMNGDLRYKHIQGENVFTLKLPTSHDSINQGSMNRPGSRGDSTSVRKDGVHGTTAKVSSGVSGASGTARI